VTMRLPRTIRSTPPAMLRGRMKRRSQAVARSAKLNPQASSRNGIPSPRQ
jgi:hypothetical protein